MMRDSGSGEGGQSIEPFKISFKLGVWGMCFVLMRVGMVAMDENVNVQFNPLQWVILCGLAQMDRPAFRPERSGEH